MRLGLATRTAAATCPHLGLAADPFSRDAHASDEHRCYAHLVGERIDRAHQKRFCLTSAHGTCPFLLVNVSEVKHDWIAEGRTWWRSVSLARQDLTAAQLGQWVGLGVAAIVRAAAYVWRLMVLLSQLVLQAWRSLRPPAPAPMVEAIEEAPALFAMETAPEVVETDLAPVLFVMETAPEVVETDLAPALFAIETAPEVVETDLAPALFAMETAPVQVVAEAAPAMGAPQAVKLAQEPPLYLTEAVPDAREWFWRAKNAETLDDVVKCLERAHALEPDNEMIASNLEWANERRETQRQAAKAKPAREATRSPELTLYSTKRRTANLLMRLAAALIGLVRTSAGLVVLAVGGVVILAGLPAGLRTDLLSAVGGPPTPWLPDVSGLASLVHVPLGGGYDLGTAFPYAIGFLAVFIGFGLLHRQPSPNAGQ
jgi:hypothetical protein